MFDAENARIEELRLQFEKQVQARLPTVRATATEYMAALTVLVDGYHAGPGALSSQMAHDTTGAANRMEADVVAAEAERHRVRRILDDVV